MQGLSPEPINGRNWNACARYIALHGYRVLRRLGQLRLHQASSIHRNYGVTHTYDLYSKFWGVMQKMDKVASFDVDAQNTFTGLCPDELPVAGGTEIVDELNAQARYAQYRLGSKDAHNPKAIWVATDEHPQLEPVAGDNVDVRWNVHAVPGTKGFELIAGLPHPANYDFFVWKGVELDMHPYGACYHDLAETLSTGVIEYLRCHDVKTVIVGGLATDYCVKDTALQLCRAGFHVILNKAACRGVAPDTTEAALAQMASAGIDVVTDAAEIDNRLVGRSP